MKLESTGRVLEVLPLIVESAGDREVILVQGAEMLFETSLVIRREICGDANEA